MTWALDQHCQATLCLREWQLLCWKSNVPVPALQSEWLQYLPGHLQDHGVLAEPSAFESIVYAGTWLPYPMKPFELVLSVRWVDLVQVRLVN